MNPLMAAVVDYMIRKKDIEGLQRLLKESVEARFNCINRKQVLYMNHVISIIKTSIKEAKI